MPNFYSPVPTNVTLLGKRICADAIKLRVWKRDHPGFRVSAKSNDWCPNKRKEREGWHPQTQRRKPKGEGTWRWRPRWERRIYKLRNIRDFWPHQMLADSHDTESLWEPPERNHHWQLLDFRSLASTTVRARISVLSRHQLAGICHGSPRKLSHHPRQYFFSGPWSPSKQLLFFPHLPKG